MSYVEWTSRDGRGRVRLYSDSSTYRFDKLEGTLDGRYDNSMFVYRDGRTGERKIVIAESIYVTEDERHVYFIVRGRKVENSGQIPTRYDRVRATRLRTRRAIGVGVNE
jgi:hypothetical protein